MAQWKWFLLFALVMTSCWHKAYSEDDDAAAEAEDDDDDDYAEPERAFLIVRKYFKEDLGLQGRNLTVNIEVYNAGVR